MSELQFDRLSAVADIDSGAGFPLNHQGKNGEQFPFLKVSDMNLPGNERIISRWNHSISEVSRVELRARAFPPGTVIFPKIGAAIATNKKRLLTKSSCVDNNVMGVVPKPDRLISEYLYHLFRSTDLSRFASASNPPSIRKSDVGNWMIRVPPLDEQRRSVGLLDRAAEIRRRADAARAKARAIIPALFLDTFGDPATNPKGWPVAELGTHADVQGGVQVSAKRSTLPIELPYLRVANVMRGRLNLSEIKLIRVTASEARRTILAQGDILVVEGHGNPNEIGRAAVWDGSIEECTHQNHLIRVRPHLSSLVSEYVETFLNSNIGRKILIQNGKTTSGLNTISTRNVKDVRLPLPPTDLQLIFADQVQRIDSLARHLDAAAVKADAMAAGLSAEVFGTPASPARRNAA